MRTVRCEGRCILLWALLAALALAPGAAQSVRTSPSAEELIRRAETLGGQRDLDGAVALLTRVTAQFPTERQGYLALASWQETRALQPLAAETPALDERRAMLRRGLYEPRFREAARDVMETYGRGVLYADDDRELRRRAAEFTAAEAPLVLGEAGVAALPGEPEAFAYALVDPDLGAARGLRRCVVTTRPLTPGPRFVHDPKYGDNPKYADDPRFAGWTFTRALWGYDFDPATRTWALRVRVLWQDAPGAEADRAALARQTARLLLRVGGLARAYTGLGPRFSPDGAVTVWLAEGGELGAESYDGHIYLEQVGEYRSPGEWVREVLHEYGHQILQPVGGYVTPEWSASGRLGERLFLRWLLDNPDAGEDSLPWIRGMDAIEARETQVDRLLRRFAALGPAAPLLRETDVVAMDGFIGLALLDGTRGAARLLPDALTRMTTPSLDGPRGFLATAAGLERAAQAGARPTVALALRHLPAGLPLWVYLREGRWRGAWTRADRAAATLVVTVDGADCAPEDGGGFSTPALAEGWHVVAWRAEGGTPSLTGLTLTRE